MNPGVKESSGRGYEAYEAHEAHEVYEAGDASRGARHTALLQRVDRADAILKMHTMRGPLALAANWPDVVETRSEQTANFLITF